VNPGTAATASNIVNHMNDGSLCFLIIVFFYFSVIKLLLKCVSGRAVSYGGAAARQQRKKWKCKNAIVF
jgi:hypothetical protein